MLEDTIINRRVIYANVTYVSIIKKKERVYCLVFLKPLGLGFDLTRR